MLIEIFEVNFAVFFFLNQSNPLNLLTCLTGYFGIATFN